MSQNGPYPGQPSQPWSAGGSEEPYRAPAEPYREPADPWGDQPDADQSGTGWGGNPTSIPPDPGYPSTGTYAPGAVWTQPAPARRGPDVPIVALVVVLGVLVCGGLATTVWLLNRDPDPEAPVQAVTPTATQSAAIVDPAPRSSNDARFVTKGQCVRNDGTTAKPLMTIAQCRNGTYQVLARVDGPTTGEADAEAKCAKVRNYTKWFFYDSELDSLDFVLCLKES